MLENVISAMNEIGEKPKNLEHNIKSISTPNIMYLSYFIIPKYHLIGKKVKKKREPSKGGSGIRLKNAYTKLIIPKYSKRIIRTVWTAS